MVLISWDGVPWFVGGGATHSAEVARLLGYAAFSGNEGVIGATDLLVTQQSVPAGGITVAAGACSILNRATAQPYGAYAARKTAAENVTIAPTGGAIRSDLIVARVENPYIAGEGWSTPPTPASGPYIHTRVISGVPSSTTTLQQVAGSSTNSGIALARIDIPASTSTITNSMIVDLRKIANPRRDRTILTAFPASNNDLTSAAFVNWPAVASWPVSVPSWATQAKVILTVAQVLHTGSASAAGSFQARLGALTVQSTAYQVDWGGTATRQTIVTGGNLAIPASARGTTQTLAAWATRSGGTGFLRADIYTSVFADIEFLEIPSAS